MKRSRIIFISLALIISIISSSMISIMFISPTTPINDNPTFRDKYIENNEYIYPSPENPYNDYNYNYFMNISRYMNDFTGEMMDASYYYSLIEETFDLTSEEIQLLNDNQFVVLNRKGCDDIVDMFGLYWREDLPIMITTDTILQLWGLIFRKVLERVEELIFFEVLRALVIETMKTIVNMPELTPHTVIYFNVALKLLNYSTHLPNNIENASNLIYNAIMNEVSLDTVGSIFTTNLTRRFIDDFSQYKPRGHYTQSLHLRTYFRLYKWFARIPFYFEDLGGMASLCDCEIKTMMRSALEITWLLKTTRINYLNSLISGFDIWKTIIDFLAIVMGKPAIVSVLDLDFYSSTLMGDDWSLFQINDSILDDLQTFILEDQKIERPEMPYVPDLLLGIKSPAKTFTLFSEIETLDSYAFSRIVHPYVYGIHNDIYYPRYLPHGLDITVMCLESNHAFQRLKQEYPDEFELYQNYEESLWCLSNNISIVNGPKKQTLEWNWIDSLKKISVVEPECEEPIQLPEFMNLSCWLDEKLTTIMSSYAQMRHDTILYTKQSYTGGSTCSTPSAFVEPYPEFYNSIANLTQILQGSFSSLETLGYDFSNGFFNYLGNLQFFEDLNNFLAKISIKELTGIELSSKEKGFLTSIYGQYYVPDGCAVTTYLEGWLPNLLSVFYYKYSQPDSAPNSRSSLIADIHTDPNSGDILHCASGLLEHVIAYVPGWNGEKIPVIGPVLSYYEMVTSDYYRMTDEEWRGIISLWIDYEEERDLHDFSQIKRGFWTQSYITSTALTTSRLYPDYSNYEPPTWF